MTGDRGGEIGSINESYGSRSHRAWRGVDDATMVALAACLAVAMAFGRVWALVPVVVAIRRASPGPFALAALAVAAGPILADRAWSSAEPRALGEYVGWAEVVGDPVAHGAGLRVTLEVDGERFDVWIFGGRRLAAADLQGGERVVVAGRRVPSPASAARRERVRHVVGRVEVQWLADVDPGSPLDRAGNRVRRSIRGAAERTMDAETAALFTGLVIGDDTRQSPAMVDEFRASGLSHLTAVSGQNVTYVVLAAAPLLRRLRPWWRWAASVGVIGWFMTVTRLEPSVLRAGLMAIVAVSAFTLGRPVTTVRLLAVAVLGLLVADPLLAWSVGFWLSVGATAGVCTVGAWLAPRLPCPVWLRPALAATLGAQVGVAIPSVAVFGRLPIVSIPANLLAVPVAGFVMLYGIPAALTASALPALVGAVVMTPARLGTRWVATVARVSSSVEPSPRWTLGLWALMVATTAAALARRWRASPPGV